MGTGIEESHLSDHPQSQMMMTCAFCGESAITSPAGGVLTIRSREGRTGAFAVHADCAVERMHPRAQALLASALVLSQPE